MLNLSNLEYAVLDLLRSGRERYGLEMVKDSDGKLKRGSIYVTLGRMEKKGYIKSRQEDTPGQPGLPRRLYQIDGLGQQNLSADDAIRAAVAGVGYA